MKPKRDPRYLAWIRTQPCLVCGSRRGVEAAHTGPHGLGQKSPDTSAIPLCAIHHRTGRDSYHRLGPRKFAGEHDIDIPAIVRNLNAKPRIRIEAGVFVAYLEGERFEVGSVQSGLKFATQSVVKLGRENRLVPATVSKVAECRLLPRPE